MKTSTKWILGILLGVVVLGLVCVVGVIGYNLWGGSSGWALETRSGQLWGDENATPWRMMPYNRMPMRPYGDFHMSPYGGMRGAWFGFFSPLRLVGFPLLCLGFLALVVIGIVLLVRGTRKPQPAAIAAAAPVAAATSEPTTVAEPAPPAEAAQTAATPCPNCARPVQADWSHCPYCGTALL